MSTLEMREHAKDHGRIRGTDRAARFLEIRAATERLVAPLSAEDQAVQSMPDASPTKWHLAHTSWFFETFVLGPAGVPAFDPAYGYLFNSYYDAVGPRHPRPSRGMLTRPGLCEVMAYRRHVTVAMLELFERDRDGGDGAVPDGLVELGLQHEQQHQELILMDLKHLLSLNPLKPAYRPAGPPAPGMPALRWLAHDGGLVETGHDGRGFAFDNERPRHRVWLEPFAIASRPVTAGEYLCFIEGGGYRRPELWLSAGWECVNRGGWSAPLYWERTPEGWRVFTLAGLQPLDPAQPVCHVSGFEAAAFARWAGRRLPREAEWEAAAGLLGDVGRVWEWTASPYVAYPGYRAPAGAVGEYNGKFMANQLVLRGGCHATPPGHARPTYRNFFPPDARWPFCGFRLAEDGA